MPRKPPGWRARDEPGEQDQSWICFFTIAFLFSGSATITAGWYANIFDATVLLFLAAATWLLTRQHALAAGLLFGLAFFSKETAALALPLILMLFAAGRIALRPALVAGLATAALGAVYFAIRSSMISFGSAADLHMFAGDQLYPTVLHLSESFWRQDLKGAGPGALGYAWLAVSLAAFRSPRIVAAALVLLLATALGYWGMFTDYQDGVLIHHLNFVGRLYLVPTALMLFMLAHQRRTLVIALLCLPVVAGGVSTWWDHARFQRTYLELYRAASETRDRPLTVDYPPKPLEDTVRGIKIGDLPEAALTIDARTGRLLRSADRGPSGGRGGHHAPRVETPFAAHTTAPACHVLWSRSPYGDTLSRSGGGPAAAVGPAQQ